MSHEVLDIDSFVDQCLQGLSPLPPQGAEQHSFGQELHQQHLQEIPYGTNAKRLFSSTSATKSNDALSHSPQQLGGTPARVEFSQRSVGGGGSSARRGGGAVEIVTHATGVDHGASLDPKSPAALRRIQLWAERKEAKRAMLVYEALQEELKECSFQPLRETVQVPKERLSPNRLYKDNRAWGFDQFVDRVVAARIQKQQKKEEDELRIAGANGSNWSCTATVPQPFEFCKYNRNEISSLKKNYDSIVPIVRQQHFSEMSTIEAPSVPSGLFSLHASHAIIDNASPGNRSQRR